MKTTLVLPSLLLSLSLTGCGLGGSSSSGAAKPSLSFADCEGHCSDQDWKLAAGGAHVTVETGGGTFAGVRSSDSSIVMAVTNPAFQGTDLVGGLAHVELFTGSPGTVNLELLDHDGQVVASHQAVVELTAKLEVKRFSNPADPVQVLEGTPQIFHVVTKDADGQTTRGDGSVAFTLGGTLTPTYVPLDGDAIAVIGAPGVGTITASCPSAMVKQEVTVVPLDAITDLVTDVFAPAADGTVTVLVGARSADGMVYAGECEWSGMEPSVTLADQVSSSIDFAPSTVSTFVLTRPGTFAVTCALAGKSATVMLTRAN